MKKYITYIILLLLPILFSSFNNIRYYATCTKSSETGYFGYGNLYRQDDYLWQSNGPFHEDEIVYILTYGSNNNLQCTPDKRKLIKEYNEAWWDLNKPFAYKRATSVKNQIRYNNRVERRGNRYLKKEQKKKDKEIMKQLKEWNKR